MKKILNIFCLLLIFPVLIFAKDPCEKEEACCNIYDDSYSFSFPKDVGVVCPRNFHTLGEFLWVRPMQQGLDYAMDQNTTTYQYDFPLDNGVVRGFSTGSQKWDWRPGFRIGFGFYDKHDYWNFDFEWTYLRMKADSKVPISNNQQFVPLFLNSALTGNDNFMPTDASCRWSGDCYVLDVFFGKPYHVSRFFVLNQNFGIKAAWIDQDICVRYVFTTKRNVYFKNDFWGVGLRYKQEGDFLLGKNVSIYGNVALALLFSKFQISQSCLELGDLIGDSGAALGRVYAEHSFNDMNQNIELGFGFTYSKFLMKNKYKLFLKIGYEFNQWLDQLQILKFYFYPNETDIVSRGNLSFDGFVFGLNLEF